MILLPNQSWQDRLQEILSDIGPSRYFAQFVRRRRLRAFRNVDPGMLEINNMKTKPTAKESDWDVSFWFAISSPLVGVLLGILAVAIFCR
jgi:hypothetical protein